MIIRNIKHRDLARLCRGEKTKGLRKSTAQKLEDMLHFLDEMSGPVELFQFPHWRPHRLKGQGRGIERWSLSVTGNWRLTFRIEDDEITEIDFTDYH